MFDLSLATVFMSLSSGKNTAALSWVKESWVLFFQLWKPSSSSFESSSEMQQDQVRRDVQGEEPLASRPIVSHTQLTAGLF